jgi:hypothetical protein
MNHVCVNVRFKFWNGFKVYTVEYFYSSAEWFVFEDEKKIDFLYCKKINPSKSKSPNRDNSLEVLNEYLETVSK